MVKIILQMKNKGATDLIFPSILFIILNALFFGVLLIFVFKTSTSVGIYEQTYAKQIALAIDKAKPGMEISINFEKALNLAKGNNLGEEQMISIKDGQVVVQLSNSGGYSFRYFSDYNVDYSVKGNTLFLKINEAEENA